MDLSIIIVNWNSADYLRKCLRSIHETVKNLNYEVNVIDNASYDGADAIIAQEFPSVRFIQSSKNLGFARANNEAFKASSGQSVVFLNPDTEVQGNAIESLHEQLRKLPQAGAVGPTLLNSDMTVQTSCIQTFPTISNQALDMEVLRGKFPRLKLWGMQALYSNTDIPAVVEVISGACLMVRRDVFENVGMFSTDYFMYTEDIDLCYKIRTAGYKAYFVKDARVIHHGGRSTKKADHNFVSDVEMRKSVYRYFQKTKGAKYADIYKLSLKIAAVLRLIVLSFMSKNLGIKAGKTIEIRASTMKWMSIYEWTMGLNKFP